MSSNFKIFFALMALLLSGCAKTGASVVDELTNPRKTCGMNITLSNSSVHDLTLSVWGAESTSRASCKPGATAEKELMVPAGQSGTVELNMECESCDIHPVTSIYLGSREKGALYSSSSEFRIVCTDTACQGR